MPATNALIHSFEPSAPPYFDDDGEQMIGSYFQFIDAADQPTGPMIGPYRTHADAAKAAQKAFSRNDFD